MSVLRVAAGAEVASVLAESHGLWGAGLSRGDYHTLWAELLASPWGRRWFRFLVWVDGSGEILSSLKVYRPEVRIGEVRGRATVVGAVFTPPARRGAGHARAMLRAVIEEARGRRDHSVVLFSDIGAPFYTDLGFVELPGREWWGSLGSVRERVRGSLELRPLVPSDLPDVARAHADACRSRPIAFVRDLDHWRFLLARAETFFSRLDGSSLARRYVVAIREGHFAGYLIAIAAGDTWYVREAGAPGADRRLIAAILREGAVGAAASGCVRVFGWFPAEVAAALPELRLVPARRTRAVQMILPLDPRVDLSPLFEPEAAFVPYLDQF